MAAAERAVCSARILDNQTTRAVRDDDTRDSRAPDADVHRAEASGDRMRDTHRFAWNDKHHFHHLPLHRQSLSNVLDVGGRRRQVNRNCVGHPVLHPVAADGTHDATAGQEIHSTVPQHVPARDRFAALLA